MELLYSSKVLVERLHLKKLRIFLKSLIKHRWRFQFTLHVVSTGCCYTSIYKLNNSVTGKKYNGCLIHETMV